MIITNPGVYGKNDSLSFVATTKSLIGLEDIGDLVTSDGKTLLGAKLLKFYTPKVSHGDSFLPSISVEEGFPGFTITTIAISEEAAETLKELLEIHFKPKDVCPNCCGYGEIKVDVDFSRECRTCRGTGQISV